jgi:hypothetical protein
MKTGLARSAPLIWALGEREGGALRYDLSCM